MSSFVRLSKSGAHLWSEERSTHFPSQVSTWHNETLALPDNGTHYLFVQDGPCLMECDAGQFQLKTGMYAAVPGAFTVHGGSGVAITRVDFTGLFQLGGPIEWTGRLRYIDGCTDSLLISPVRFGDPCLNLLHIPPKTAQSAHTHPSLRAGIIVSGSGVCITPDEEILLAAGLIFVIPDGAEHSFHTQDDSLRVIAYHPDSDFGPTDESHPMINRTILSVS